MSHQLVKLLSYLTMYPTLNAQADPGSMTGEEMGVVAERQFLTGNSLVNTVLLVSAALIIIYIYRDAKARDSYPELWAATLVIVVLFLPPIGIILGIVLGLIVYLIVRPKGKLEFCPHCGVPHLEHSMQCAKCKGPLVRDCHRCRTVYDYLLGTCPECGAPN